MINVMRLFFGGGDKMPCSVSGSVLIRVQWPISMAQIAVSKVSYSGDNIIRHLNCLLSVHCEICQLLLFCDVNFHLLNDWLCFLFLLRSVLDFNNYRVSGCL